ARRQGSLFIVAIKVEQLFSGLGIEYRRPHRDAQDNIGRTGAILVGAAAVLAVPGAVQARIAKIDQGVDIAVGHGIDTAASSAVPAVGSAFGNEFLAAKA